MTLISVREVNKDTLDIVAKNGSETGAYRLKNNEPRGVKGLIKRYKVIKVLNAREKGIQKARRSTHTGCKGYKINFKNSGMAMVMRKTWRIVEICLMATSIVISTYFIASWINVVITNTNPEKALATWNIFKAIVK